MAKRDDFDDFFGDDDDTSIVDTRADGRLYRVPLGRIAPNLVNPRTDFGTEDQLIDLGKSLARRQNQPCPVVSRTAYLKLWPDHADRVGDIDYVLVSGERRYRAATTVGLPSLDCVVNDGFAADRKTFMEAVVSENVDRQNFDPIEEAYAVQALVHEFGSNRAVAQHFERVDGWVTQRVLLTHLDPQMQALVRQKKMPLEAARTLGKKARDHGWSADEQAAWLDEWQVQQTAASQARKAAKQAAKERPPEPPALPPSRDPAQPAADSIEPAAKSTGSPPSFTAVKQPDPAEGEPEPVEREHEPERTRPPETIPEPRTVTPSPNGQLAAPVESTPPDSDPAAQRRQVKMPWHDGEACAEIAIQKMQPMERRRMVERLLEQEKVDKEDAGRMTSAG